MTSDPTAAERVTDGPDNSDIESGGGSGRRDGLKARGRAFREHVAQRPTLELGYRIVVGVVGGLVLLVGIVTIPYPGPGWALVFAGFGILATEFVWAHHTLNWVRGKYRIVMDWYTSRGWFIKVLGAVGTFALVLVTLWLLGTCSMVAGWIGVDWPWLRSPLMS